MKFYNYSVFLIVLLLLLNGCSNQHTYTEDDWGFNNHGQQIKGVSGVTGIDISPYEEGKNSTTNIKVAIVDTGIDVVGLKLDGVGEGYDFYNNDSSTYDSFLYDYHGTYITDIVSKVAKDVTIIPVKFMEGSEGSVEDAILAMKYAVDAGAQVINCSWNDVEFNEDMYNLIKDNPNILFVCAASNTSINLDSNPMYPCCYELDNVISVIAVDNQGKKYDACGYGKRSADIAAPGVNILVNLPEGDTDMVSGSSVATAFVTGAACCVLSVDDGIDPKGVKSALLKCSTPINGLTGYCVCGGIVNIRKTIKYIKEM